MKANELRIGNWIKYTYALSNDIEFCKVIGVKNDGRVYFRSDGCKISLDANEIDPIELTEELLLKIGFEKKNDCYILSNQSIFFVYYKDAFKQELLASVKREGKYYYNTNEIKNYDIKYLHELQNAYFLLTGKELEVEV